MIVVQQHRLRRRLFPGQRRESGSVHEVDIEPAVLIVVEQSYARARGLENSVLFRRA